MRGDAQCSDLFNHFHEKAALCQEGFVFFPLFSRIFGLHTFLVFDQAKAGYQMTVEQEADHKGLKDAFGLTDAMHKINLVTVTSKSGELVFSQSGHSTTQLVDGACTAIRQWKSSRQRSRAMRKLGDLLVGYFDRRPVSI